MTSSGEGFDGLGGGFDGLGGQLWHLGFAFSGGYSRSRWGGLRQSTETVSLLPLISSVEVLGPGWMTL